MYLKPVVNSVLIFHVSLRGPMRCPFTSLIPNKTLFGCSFLSPSR